MVELLYSIALVLLLVATVCIGLNMVIVYG